MLRINLAAAAAIAIAVLSFEPQAARAYEAPWCAVINLGVGDAYWDCQYASLEQCRPNVLAGNRGFCNPNPRYYAMEQPRRKHLARRRHHIRRY